MTPHEANRPPTGHSRSRDSREMLPIILGAAAVIILGVWFYTGRDEVNPVTGREIPASMQTPGK